MFKFISWVSCPDTLGASNDQASLSLSLTHTRTVKIEIVGFEAEN